MSAILTILNLASVIRQNVAPDQIGPALRRRGMLLRPDARFWLHLSHSARLITAGNAMRVSRFLPVWLGMPPDAQFLHLLEAWQDMPADISNRRARRRLFFRLRQGLPLSNRDQRELPALQALGLCDGEQIGPWGLSMLGKSPAPTLLKLRPWQLDGIHLHITTPVNWRLLWELERFLSPCRPFEYEFTSKALRLASQRGEPQELIDILQTGLNAPLPPELTNQVLGQPALHSFDGKVLSFSDPAELRQLRKSNALRPYLDSILSPRHVIVDHQAAPRLLRLLERRGVYARPLAEDEPETDLQMEPIKWQTGESKVELRRVLTWAMKTQAGIQILYSAPNSVRPEPRRITPLLIEERGGHEYIIAYCHTRRGQRTFRLDRMELA